MKANRREALRLAAALPLALHAAPAHAQQLAPLFFTPEEFLVIDELTEMIIPADDHSPGARAAQVAAYIDRRLAESFEPEPRKLWRDGLAPFLSGTPSQRLEMLQAAAQQEEGFFSELKTRTARAYYSSDIGIHRELEYK